MKKQLFVLAVASTAALTACHGLSKVEFAKFKEKVEAVEVPKVKEVKVSGKIDGRSVKVTYAISDNALSQIFDAASFTLSGDYSDDQKAAIYAALGSKSAKVATIAEDSNSTYYVGMGFKVKSGSNVAEWNGKGLLASLKTEKDSLKVSWVKA